MESEFLALLHTEVWTTLGHQRSWGATRIGEVNAVHLTGQEPQGEPHPFAHNAKVGSGSTADAVRRCEVNAVHLRGFTSRCQEPQGERYRFESPWVSWRLHALEERMESCRKRSRRGCRRRGGIPLRRSSRRSEPTTSPDEWPPPPVEPPPPATPTTATTYASPAPPAPPSTPW